MPTIAVTSKELNMSTFRGKLYSKFLGRYIVEYMVGNLVFVKRDFRPFIRRYTSPNKILNMVISTLIHFCSFISN